MNSRFTNTFQDGTFIKYLVKDVNYFNKDKYYCGSGNFTENINKAKVYYRLCDAKNAVTSYEDYSRGKKVKLKVFEYIISQRIDNIKELN